MSEQEKFIIDANCFIAPYKQYYNFIFDSDFWNELIRHIKAGNIIFIKSVRDEVLQGKDELADWVKKLDIIPTEEKNNPEIIKNYSLIMNYLNNKSIFSVNAQKEWSSSKTADPWIVATAVAEKITIISFEKKIYPSKGQLFTKPKIPNFADYFGIKVADLFYMMKELKFKL